METQQDSTRHKKCHKLKPHVRQFIYEKLGEWCSLRDIAKQVRQQFKVQIHYTAINGIEKRYPEEAGPAIQAAREKFRNSYSNFPIADKAWRLKEILDMYSKTKPKEKYFRAKLLALGRAEIGENFDKLANAIRDSGGDAVVNIVTYSGEEFDRAVRELAAVSANSNTPSRF